MKSKCHSLAITTNRKVYKLLFHEFSMAKSNGLVGKLKAAAIGTAIGLAALGFGGNKANAALVPVNSFRDFMGSDVLGGSNFIENYIDWDAWQGDNLLYKCPETGEEKVVPKEGVFHVGYLNSDGFVGGYASNDNAYSNNYEGFEGWLSGNIYKSRLSEPAADALIVWDQNGDGIGNYDTDTGTWHLGSDDILYRKEDILFGDSRTRGDLSQLPVWSPVDTWQILPTMVIDPIPEPASIGLLGLGAGYLALSRKKQKDIKSIENDK